MYWPLSSSFIQERSKEMVQLEVYCFAMDFLVCMDIGRIYVDLY